VLQVNNNASLTFKIVIERNVAPTNFESVNYLEPVVRAVPERCRNRRTFITDNVTNFCNLEFCVSLEKLKYPAAYIFGIGDLFDLKLTV
jgi:hypothetical protein